MIESSASPVPIMGRTSRAPQRASANSPTRKGNAVAIERIYVGGRVRLAEDRLQQCEVERDEDVLHDDDPEDHPVSGSRDPPQVEHELGDDRRRRRPDHAGNDEDFLLPEPSDQPNTSPAPSSARRRNCSSIAAGVPRWSSSSMENSIPRWKSRRTRSYDGQDVEIASGPGVLTNPGVRGPSDPGDDEERDRSADPTRRPARSEQTASNRAAPRMRVCLDVTAPGGRRSGTRPRGRAAHRGWRRCPRACRAGCPPGTPGTGSRNPVDERAEPCRPKGTRR